MNESFVKEENVDKLAQNIAIKIEPPENERKMLFVENKFEKEDTEIIQEIAGKSNYLQLSLKEEIIEEIEIKKELVNCEDTKEDIEKIEIKEEIKKFEIKEEIKKFEKKEEQMKSEPDENENYSYKEMIIKALDTVNDIPEAFACGGIMPKAKLQLSVKGVGDIKLPLSFEQADVLKTKCTAAPFGRGSETLVHKSVRDAWQVDAEDITLNKEFNVLIEEKMADIIQCLMGESFAEDQRKSITESHKVELYKIVYYEKGGHFAAHRDTEKAPGMFATLVIQLPAGHKGGALVIKHKGNKEVFNHENNSKNNFFFTAFFADCEHKLRKVTDGHRLVLIYNIIRKNSHSTIPIDNDISSSKYGKFLITIKKAVENWKSDGNGPNYLTLKLDHLYTDTNISFQNLKGKDKKISDALCSSADIEVYLATITKTVTRHGEGKNPEGYAKYGYDGWYHDPPYDSDISDGSENDSSSDDSRLCDSLEEYTDCRESEYTLTNWIDVKNNMIKYIEHLDEKEMLIDEMEMFDDEDYDHKGYVEYTGNAGCSQEYTYKNTAIVICPKSYAFALSCKKDITSIIAECKYISEQGDALKKALMLQSIMNYIKMHHRAIMQLKNDDNVARILNLLRLFENNIKSAIFFLKSLLKIGLPTANSGDALANLINKLSWENLETNVLELVKECAASHILGFAQLVRALILHGLQDQAIKVVEMGTPQIIARKDAMSSDNLARWLSLLASYDILTTQYYTFFNEILNMKDYIMIEIISEMHRSLQPKKGSQNRIFECFQNILYDLLEKGWKNLTPKLVILVIPVLVFVDKNNLLNGLVQAIIGNENSSNFLEPILNLPIILKEKNNPSVQLMVQTRLEQLENIQEPVVNWAQPNATLVGRHTHGRGPHGGPMTYEIHNFLRGAEQSKTFGNFEGIAQVRSFGKKYFPNGNYNQAGHYHAIFVASGIGKRSKCKIIKTKSVFDEQQMKKYTILCNEAKDLRKKFKVAKKRSLE